MRFIDIFPFGGLFSVNAENYKIDIGKIAQQHLEKHDLPL